MNQFDKENPFFLYTCSFITVSLSAGLVYGYPHLRQNLIINGSKLDESELGLIYTIGSWSAQGGGFFFGVARDCYGTRNVVFIALLSAMAGCVGIAFSDKNDTVALSVSLFFVGLGCGVQTCLLPVASLFEKKWQGTVIASFTGAFQISALAFLALKKITPDRIQSYGIYSILLCGLVLCSLLLLPKDRFVKDHSSNKLELYNNVSTRCTKENRGDKTVIESVKANLESDGDVTPILLNNNENDNIIPITSIALMKSKEYFFLIFWFSIMVLIMQYYIGTIGLQLERKGDKDGRYINLFSMCYALVALLSPIIGKIADIFGHGFTQSIATLLVVSSLLILSIDGISLNIHLVGIVFYSIGRMTAFGTFFANIGKRFGYSHYGTLAGVGLLISATVSLLQYPLIETVAKGGEFLLNLVCGCVLFSVGIPYCIWLGLTEREERKELQITDPK